MTEAGDLAAFLAQGWAHLGRGVADRRAPARHPTLATVSASGRPEQRTVVLRAADRAEATLEIHTDLATPKVGGLRANRWAGLHVWVPRAQMQIRIDAEVEILDGAAAAPYWARVPPGSRVAYGTVPAPGTPIADAFAYEKPADPDRFCVLRCHVRDIDLLHLGTPHRRALYSAETGWAGTWCAP